MTGADLANVINEAALLTARENGTVITGAALEEAVDRVVGGPRRKSRIISEHEKKITAYHEGGHTLAAWAMPDIEPDLQGDDPGARPHRRPRAWRCPRTTRA